MKTSPLQTRFFLAGVLVLTSAIVSSLWSAWSFVRLNSAVTATLNQSQRIIDLVAALQNSLEREDDALLLALAGQAEQAEREMAIERERQERFYGQLTEVYATDPIQGTGQPNWLLQLERHIEAYRAAGERLGALATEQTADLLEYHRQINPQLRQVVATCDAIREENFQRMQQAGLRARDEAARGTRWVLAISGLTALLGISAALWLARSVLGPVGQLTRALEQLRQGDFDSRVAYQSSDELGQLAVGFNRMAESIDQYRQSSLGELLSAKLTLESTLDALPDAVMVFSPDATLTALNPPAREFLRARGTEQATCLDALQLPRVHHAAIESALVDGIAVVPSLDFSKTIDIGFEHRSRRWVLAVVPIADFEPRRFGAVVILKDVTDFARLDELRSELIGVASHELNSPLTSLRMNLLMLSEETQQFAPRQQELIRAAVEGCDELGLTIDELLDVTRIEAGQLRLNLVPLDVLVIIQTVCHRWQPRLADAGLTLAIENDLPHEAQRYVLGDRTRLSSVLGNLLGNALKYAPHGSRVTLELLSGQNAQLLDGPSLQIAVTDQGPGIPVEFRDKVFEKFFRIEHSQTSGPAGVWGTGIGLYLCREIVRAHGGVIACSHGPGGDGTRIALELPVPG